MMASLLVDLFMECIHPLLALSMDEIDTSKCKKSSYFLIALRPFSRQRIFTPLSIKYLQSIFLLYSPNNDSS